MRAAAYTETESSPSPTQTRPIPDPTTSSIDVAYVGVCGTDRNIIHGSMDARVDATARLRSRDERHDPALGTDVTGWNVGDSRDRVMTWTGTAPAPRAATATRHICQNLEFIRHRLPRRPSADLDRAGIHSRPASGEPVAAHRGHHRARRRGRARRAPLRAAVRAIARSSSAGSDRRAHRLGRPPGRGRDRGARAGSRPSLMIEQLGFTTVDPSATDATAWVEEWTGGAGADVVFEVSGPPPRCARRPPSRACAARSSSWRSTRRRAKSTCSASSGASSASSARASISASTSSAPSNSWTRMPSTPRRSSPRCTRLTGVTDALAELQSGRALKVLIDVQADA